TVSVISLSRNDLPFSVSCFAEKFEGGFEQDIDDEGKEDKEDEEGDGEV
ncbi:hypothetical protein Tco_1444263, partial [Tanacetum coccineum]